MDVVKLLSGYCILERRVLMKKFIGFITIFITLFLLCGVANAAGLKYASSSEGEINLYMTPSDSGFVITKIPACSELEIIKTERNSCSWHK